AGDPRRPPRSGVRRGQHRTVPSAIEEAARSGGIRSPGTVYRIRAMGVCDGVPLRGGGALRAELLPLRRDDGHTVRAGTRAGTTESIGMKYEVKLPDLGDDAGDEATVSYWLVEEGDEVTEADDLVEMT